MVSVCEMEKNKRLEAFEDGSTYNCPICQKLIRQEQDRRMLRSFTVELLVDRIEVRSGQIPDHTYFHQSCLPDRMYPSKEDTKETTTDV